jgi:hypothetical protein
VQLFLAWLVHDSSSRRHTLARLRGAQAGFRLHGFRLDVPPSERVLDVLSGPGLNAPLVTAQTAARIRAGVAHPVIAAGIAVVLITGVQALALASMPSEALSPQNDTLRLAWHPPNRTLVRASEVASRSPATTAVFHVPAAARPLLRPRDCPAAVRGNAVQRRADRGRGRQLQDQAALPAEPAGNVADQGYLHPRRFLRNPIR